MDVGVLRRDLPGLAGAAAEIEARVRALKRRRCDERATQRVEAALEVHRARRRPERLQDRDLLVHQVVALLLAPADALGGGLGFALPGDQVDRDAAAGKLVERRAHLPAQEDDTAACGERGG